MYVFVFAGDKGGIGKSTLSLLWALSLIYIKKQKGAFIDLDPQGNSSGYLIKMLRDNFHDKGKKPSVHPDYNPNNPQEWKTPIPGISSIADVFHGTDDIYPYPTWVEHLDLFPSFASRLEEAEMQPKNEVIKNVKNRFCNFISLLSQSKEYDFIVIDTRPSKGPLTMAAMSAATHVFFPAVMEEWSIEGTWGMHQLFKQEDYVRQSDNPIKLVGILPNKVENTNLHQGYLNDLKNFNETASLILPEVKKRILYSEMVVDGAEPKTVFQLPEDNVARVETEKWCNEAYKRIYQNG